MSGDQLELGVMTEVFLSVVVWLHGVGVCGRWGGDDGGGGDTCGGGRGELFGPWCLSRCARAASCLSLFVMCRGFYVS